MEIKSLLTDVKVTKVPYAGKVEFPAYSDENWQSNQTEFSMQVKGTGRFYACNGNRVEYSVEPGSDSEWVKLYLNGQVLVALLHQRRIISFHASSFVYNDYGVMILGETGAGKSSLTLSFVLNGAGFMTDDLTPVIFRNGTACIMPVYKDVKVRPDTAQRLDIDSARLRDAEAGTGKHYFEIEPARTDYHRLDIILKITAGGCKEPIFREPETPDKFSTLRSEICSWEMLSGMPDTEAEYLHQLLEIVKQVHFVNVVRPADIDIGDFYKAVRGYLEKIP